MNGKETWTAVRVSRATKAELDSLREIWTAQSNRLDAELGSAETRSGQVSKRDEIGMDQVIRRLIILWKRHQARARKSAAKRRIARLQESNPPEKQGE